MNEEPSSAAALDTYRDLSGLTNTLLWGLKATILLSAVASVSTYLELSLLKEIVNDTVDYLTFDELANASDLRQSVIGVVQFFMFVAVGIVFLRWIYFSNSNSRSLGARGMRFTPGWSIGWYFIPIAGLFKPFQVMKEIWQTSKDANNWEIIQPPAILSIWWALWIISLFLDNVSLRLSMGADDLNEMVMSSSIMLFSDLIEIPLSLVALKLVSQIFEMQQQSRHRLQIGFHQ